LKRITRAAGKQPFPLPFTADVLHCNRTCPVSPAPSAVVVSLSQADPTWERCRVGTTRQRNPCAPGPCHIRAVPESVRRISRSTTLPSPQLPRTRESFTLPEIGPPPPRHTVKTFGTLTALSFVGIGVYAFAPSSFTGINKETALKEAIDDFKNAWTKPPVFDKDNSAINYLGHPYFGMNFYLSQRNYGESPLYSFFFSTFTSTAFEYFIESWAEQPSIQDLIITPIVGSILGELVYLATQEMRKDGFTKAEKVILTLINPLYVLQNGYQ
jgi:uncharacterized protein DUF3943